MKISNFLAGIVAGSVVSILIFKKVSVKRKDAFVSDSLSKANETIDSLRSSIDSFTKQLGERIESEQTYAARCDELRKELESQSAEIETLKHLCAMQEAQNKKLEARG